jgi:hypothetical protein
LGVRFLLKLIELLLLFDLAQLDTDLLSISSTS